MFQNLLVDRFHLKAHWETRDVRAFSLEVRDSKPLVAASSAGPSGPSRRAMRTSVADDGHRFVTATLETLADLAAYLSVQLGGQVSDRTGLSGEYDFRLDYRPVQNTGSNPNAIPEIQTAAKSLGVKLDHKMEPAKFLIVDQADKVPTDN